MRTMTSRWNVPESAADSPTAAAPPRRSETVAPVFEESFRTLRTNILLRTNGREKSFLITSANPREGKSTVAANLACALAASQKRVLLIDTDLRRPHLHEIFQIDHEPGLSEVLAGARPLPDVYQPVGSHLAMVSSGRLPRDPQQLFAAPIFSQALSKMEEDFDIVLLDSAPVLAVADTTLLAPQVHGVILILKYGNVTEAEALLVKERLEATRARFIGCVLNQFDNSQRVAYHPYLQRYANGHQSKTT